MTRTYPIDPMPKPRMTRKDKWNPSRAASRYFAWRDLVVAHQVDVQPAGDWIIFRIAMPKGWSQKKKDYMRDRAHQQKPDKDNLEKALMDAVHKRDDSHIWDSRTTKLWADQGSITVVTGGAGLVHPCDKEAK